MTVAQLVVICKEPVPGRVKTRLCPPCTPEGAAAVAAGALADTLAAVAGTSAGRRVVALDGHDGPWLDDLGGVGFDRIPQVAGGLGDRLAAVVADCFAAGPGPVLVVGMDTPQLRGAHLARAVAALEGADAVLGPAEDGGYWCVGLARPLPGAFDGVPMSRSTTGTQQRRRLEALGARVAEVDRLRDVDRVEDARAVAAEVPGSAFARAVAEHVPPA